MKRSRWRGLSATEARFAALDSVGREELKESLRQAAKEVLPLQQEGAPVYAGKSRKDVEPGLLKQGLKIEEQMDRLRVRVGFPQIRGKRSKLWYAIIMEKGRKDQLSPIRRLRRGARADWRKMVREGTARMSRKPDSLIVKPGKGKGYVHVTALPALKFVHIEERLETVMDKYRNRLLSKVAEQ